MGERRSIISLSFQLAERGSGKKKDRSRSNRAQAYPTSRSVCSMVRCYDLLTYNLRENECHPTISIPQPRREFSQRSLCYSGH